MLDIYSRECPRCHTQLKREPVLCPSCHHLLPRKVSKTRRVLENTTLGVAIVAVAVAMLAPDLVRQLRPQPAAAVAPAIKPWNGPGPEPVARAWAAPIETSLQDACRSTYSRYDDKKYVILSLTQYVPAATRELGKALTQENLRLSPDEEKDAMAILGDDARFMGECLRIGYEAIKGCEPFKSDLAGPQASNCMVPRVQRALAPAPYRLCANEAKIDRVRRSCQLAAENVLRLLDKQ